MSEATRALLPRPRKRTLTAFLCPILLFAPEPEVPFGEITSDLLQARFWITSHLPTTYQNLDDQVTPRGQKIWAAPNTGQS